MSAIRELLYAIPSVGIMDIVDILVVAFLFYTVLCLIRSTSASRVARGILLVLAVTWLTGIVHMYTLNWILNKILELGVIALVIMFQPELRRGLERVGGKFKLSFAESVLANRSEAESAIEATVAACEIMSKERVGALIVFERETSLEEYVRKATSIDAKVSVQLLRNLFFPKASLHDGAVIIRNGRVAAAGCVMPLTENSHLSSDL
ncbi:MAG: diadenylate cyclase, partial [Clostridia bacterium]|nr:diadenylate cyclase [Clostridia bacterium]